MLFYAEKWDVDCNGKSFISDRGVFMSIEEFIPYRVAGWSAASENDRLADEQIKLRQTPVENLEYVARMQCGENEREEICRRIKQESPVLGEDSPAQNTKEICHTAPNSASAK